MWAYHGQQLTVTTRQNHLQPNTVGCDSGLFQAQASTADRTTSGATLTHSVAPSPSGDTQPSTAIWDPCGQTEPTLVVRGQTLTTTYRWGRLASGVPGSQMETPQTMGQAQATVRARGGSRVLLAPHSGQGLGSGGRHCGIGGPRCGGSPGRPLPGPEAGLVANDGVADGNDAGLLQQREDLAQQNLHTRRHHAEVVALRYSQLDVGAIWQDLVARGQAVGLSWGSPAFRRPERRASLRCSHTHCPHASAHSSSPGHPRPPHKPQLPACPWFCLAKWPPRPPPLPELPPALGCACGRFVCRLCWRCIRTPSSARPSFPHMALLLCLPVQGAFTQVQRGQVTYPRSHGSKPGTLLRSVGHQSPSGRDAPNPTLEKDPGQQQHSVGCVCPLAGNAGLHPPQHPPLRSDSACSPWGCARGSV